MTPPYDPGADDGAGSVSDSSLLAHEAQQYPSLWRRIAIVQVLAQRGFISWTALAEAVEAALEPGIFGDSPRARLSRDLRALRASGVAIGYSRVRGAEGYYLRTGALGETASGVVESAVRALDPVAASALALEASHNGSSPEELVLDLLAESENATQAEPLRIAIALVAALGGTLDLPQITASAAESGLGGLWAGLLDAIWRRGKSRRRRA